MNTRKLHALTRAIGLTATVALSLAVVGCSPTRTGSDVPTAATAGPVVTPVESYDACVWAGPVRPETVPCVTTEGDMYWLIFTIGTNELPDVQAQYRACATEDSGDPWGCVWDADVRGNGQSGTRRFVIVRNGGQS